MDVGVLCAAELSAAFNCYCNLTTCYFNNISANSNESHTLPPHEHDGVRLIAIEPKPTSS